MVDFPQEIPTLGPVDAKNAETELSFPLVVKRKNASATIYRRERVKNGRIYVEFRLSMFDQDGRRVMTNYPDVQRAIRAAEAQLDALGRGLAAVTTLSGPERLDFLSAKRILPAGATLTDAVNALLRQQEASAVTPITVPNLVAAFIASREKSTRRGGPASDVYLSDLTKRLAKLSTAFPSDDVSDLTAPRLEAWIDALGLVGRNRFNTLRLVRTLLKWGQNRGHLREGKLPTDKLDIHPGEGGAIEIFTPAELAKLLAAAKPEMVPYLALGAFAGLRTAETKRLDWADLKLERGFVEIAAHKAKTKSRRLVPVLPALAEWLTPIRKAAGAVLPFVNVSKQVDWLARDSGVKWKQNALRHSFVSYRLAAVQNVDQVALEAGNSPSMIFQHYRELVTPADASAWFSVRPAAPGNVVPAAFAGDPPLPCGGRGVN